MHHKKRAAIDASRAEIIQELIDLNERGQLTDRKWRELLQELQMLDKTDREQSSCR
jgi:hypothetical protein